MKLLNREIRHYEQAERLGNQLLNYGVQNLDFVVALQIFFVRLSWPHLLQKNEKYGKWSDTSISSKEFINVDNTR